MKNVIALCTLFLLSLFALTTHAAPSLQPTLAPNAQILSDDFDYPDGNLVGQGGWTAHSGGGNKPIQVSSGTVSLTQSSGSGEDANLSFTQRGATDTTFFSFNLLLPSGQTVNPDADGLYFAHFRTGTAFRARVFITAPAAGGDFGIGLSADTTSPGAIWGTDLNFDTSYYIVASYNAATGESQLWVDPASELSPSISHTGTAGTQIASFAFRQSDDYTGSQIIDGVRVGETFNDVPTSVRLRAAQAQTTPTALPLMGVLILSILTIGGCYHQWQCNQRR